MKSSLTIALFLFAINAFAQNKQSHFKGELDFGGGTVLSTYFDVALSHGQFAITSPKNADVRIVGGKARLGRLFGKSPKKGSSLKSAANRKTTACLGKPKFRCSAN